MYTPVHAAALRAYRALATAHGSAAARELMGAAHRGDLDTALRVVDAGHELLRRDRAALDAVEVAAELLVRPDDADDRRSPGRRLPPAEPARTELSVGELARRIGVVPATLRGWERAGILRPRRVSGTGHRSYRPDDVRDAELAHLLRRGGLPLERVAEVLDRVRTAGGPAALAGSLAEWRDRLRRRGLALLHSAGELDRYLQL